MPSVSETLGGNAAPYTIEFNGKTYRAQMITQKVKSQVERWLEKRAMATVMRFRADLDLAEFRALSAAVTADIAAGKYSFGGPFSIEALGTMAGGVAFASCIFGCTEDEMQELFASKTDEVTQILELIQSQSFPQKKTEQIPQTVDQNQPPTCTPADGQDM